MEGSSERTKRAINTVFKPGDKEGEEEAEDVGAAADDDPVEGIDDFVDEDLDDGEDPE